MKYICFISFASLPWRPHSLPGPVSHSLSLPVCSAPHPHSPVSAQYPTLTALAAFPSSALLSTRELAFSLLLRYNFHFLSIVVRRYHFHNFPQ